MITLEEGRRLVRLARSAVENYFLKKDLKFDKKEKSGVFVSLHVYPGNTLRGCIGYSNAVYGLNEAVVRASLSAAFEDPRFLPLKKEELDKMVFHVSVLTKPRLIKNKEDYKKEIKIGRDGLIVKCYGYSGLLLPDVFKKESMEEALDMTCNKAGLLEDTWKEKDCSVFTFETQLFIEEKPNGNIIEVKNNVMS